MIYLQPRRKQYSGVSMPVRIGIALVFLLSLIAYTFPKLVQGTFQTIVYPLWQFESNISNFFGGASHTLITRSQLLQENTRLRNEYRSSEHLAARSEMLLRENIELKKLLGVVVADGGVLAPILSRPPLLAYDTLILGIGQSEDIEVGDHVYVAQDVVIGEISAVYPQTTLVTLFSTPGRENEVRVGTSTVTAHGRGLGSFIIAVPRELSVAIGTPVTLPGMASALLGIVEDKEAHPADPVEILYVRSPYTLSAIDFVSIRPKAFPKKSDLEETAHVDTPYE